MTKGEMNAKAEACMMGFIQSIESDEEVKYIFDYVSKVLATTHHVEPIKGEDVLKLVYQYVSTGEKIRYMHIGTLEDMVLISFPLIRPTVKYPERKLLSTDGCFSYVYNYSYTDFSELGYSFFKRDANNRIRRIG